MWIHDPTESLNHNPIFYNSLHFYFFTMPFVFADPGINYENVSGKEIKGTTYKGIKISYNEGVGDSPEDEYIVYYHPETHKMEWLAYTVTFQTQEDSDNFSMLHYKSWQDVNGLLLPREMQGYKHENGEVGDPKSDPRTFESVNITTDDKPSNFYDMPAGSEVDSK